ncbi:thiamine pyrophosphate protein [Thalassobaculum fulvum]|uniref:Thiamine pyrophosphate protein n=1 Tax=Thalassobaculum fulvum TaxID=1633335 RepID=A0A918XNG6_9PROT|nr:thiamine pyrophosphate-dependent enzyme [Thalassobaculum fulvum]GHD42101.1 thiamine pyrophosphate protein [Thalassobaculum fulvum]
MEAGAALVEALVDAGVDTAFTVPGESFLPVVEALRHQRNRIRLVSVRHEAGGAFAAHGYGVLTGRPAAVFVSRGPGATNASIGLHAAQQDSVPLVLFIGQIRSYARGREAFQEIDATAAFGSMTKAVLEPSSPADLPALARRAVEIAVEGRPGPVVVTMPRDFGDGEVPVPAELGPVVRPAVVADAASLDALVAALGEAKRPVIVAGELARRPEAREPLAAFAAALGAPVLAAYRCQDVIDNELPAYAGHLEINPVPYQAEAVAASDLLVVLGSRLDGITSREEAMVKGKRLAHVHPDAVVLARFGAAVPVQADVAPTLEAITARLPAAPADRLAWRDGLHAHYLAFSTPGNVNIHGEMDLSKIAAAIRETLPDDAVLVTDGGSFARWFHRYLRFTRPQTQGGSPSGAMGCGVPGAIGAALATNDGRPVVAFVGDGGFMMNGQELSTAVREGVPIKVVLCDNEVHGSILKGQLDRYGDESSFATRMGSPDFELIARGYGAAAWTVRSMDEWRPAFAAALAHEGPALIRLMFDARDIAPYGNEKDAV